MNSGEASGYADAEFVSGIGRVALGDLLRRAARRMGDKPAVIDENASISYAELDAAASRFSNLLLQRGIKPGARVVTLCGNTIDYIKVIYGIHKAATIWVPINTMLAASDMEYIVDHVDAELIVVDASLASTPAIASLLEKTDRSVLYVDADFDDLLKGFSSDEPQLAIGERDLALIMYTSGTTSRPKGAMHCHLSVFSGALCNIGEWSVSRDDRILIILPMFHVAAHALFTTFLLAGATIVLQKGFDPAKSLAAIERARITFFVGLPMMYAGMLDHPTKASTDLSSLRFCVYSMAPMAKTLIQRLVVEFCPNFALTSGQTEIYPITVMFRPEQQLQRFGNYWGESAMIDDLGIMDDEGNLLPRGEIGEIVHRGPNVMLGYYRDPAATAEVRRFGWHHTGDLGMIDPDGQLIFVDRKKDIIKSGGENVPSAKVEEVLLRHPAIANAAVIGVPHARWEEAIVGCVQLKPGAQTDEAELIAHCRGLLGGFEVPKAIEILEKIPTTATSKLRKVELRELFIDRFAEQS
jgi:long-chain acyl-CoA synthetase